jgi:hypothetical protein
MRGLHILLLTAIPLTVVGCRSGATPPATGPAKLEDAIVGKWQGTEAKNEITRTFNKDGAYTFESGDVKYTGQWKAVDDKRVEVTYRLTKEQAEAAKPIWNASTDVINRLPHFEGSDQKPKEPEPTEGDNNAIFSATMTGDVMAWGIFQYRKAK